MNTIGKLGTLAGLITLAGCATSITPEGARIQVHNQRSTLLPKCQALGPLSAEASGWTALDPYAQAEAALRDAASKAYAGQVDSITVTNFDKFGAKIVAQGTAYKCF